MLTASNSPAAAQRNAIEARLRRVLELHLHPREGSPFWIRRVAEWGVDLRGEVRSLDDLARLPSMTPEELERHPLLDFTPRSLRHEQASWLRAQTGGATDNPVWTVYSPAEFEDAFVAPFAAAATHVGFPRGGVWLYAGPSGPHIIGRAARSLARALGAPDPFTIDFDPRWARKLPAGSFAQQRYVQHAVDQALAVIRTQSVDVLFTTPPLLAHLARAMGESQRRRIRGVHYGGTHLSAAQLGEFQQAWFPDAVHLSGYGNTLFGCCLELSVASRRVPAYFPHGQRLILEVVPDERRPPDGRGRVRFTRLDDTVLLINMLERDAASPIAAPADAPPGFGLPGVCDVGPRTAPNRPAVGLY